MHLKLDELRVYRFEPEDGTESAAMKVVHRPSQTIVVHDDSDRPVDNLRGALAQLVAEITTNPKLVTKPDFYPADRVTVRLPDSFQEGDVTAIEFNFRTRRWKYDVECRMHTASGSYDSADLYLDDDEDD